MKNDPLDELVFMGFTVASQRELMAEYCSDIEFRIAAAGSEDKARKLVRESCNRFQKECESRILRTALEQHVWSLFRRRWNGEGLHTRG